MLRITVKGKELSLNKFQTRVMLNEACVCGKGSQKAIEKINFLKEKKS